MRKIVVGGDDYASFETFDEIDERNEIADEWAEVSTVKTELFWPAPDASAGPIPTIEQK